MLTIKEIKDLLEMNEMLLRRSVEDHKTQAVSELMLQRALLKDELIAMLEQKVAA